jgi:MFS transporter, Spinster family, sphingosine-1-phosphate transporter
VILVGVRDAPRGRSEPELENLEQMGVYRFNWQVALGLFAKRSLILLFLQGFVGVFPWNVISSWFFYYLEKERFYSSEQVLATMAPAILVLASGYFVGGAVGDFFFKRTPRGRMLVSMVAVLVGAILLSITLSVPLNNPNLFTGLLMLTALFIPFASANVIATVYDITLPEVRSTALSVQYFIENGGAALAPWLAGTLAEYSSMHASILLICVTAWIIGSVFLAFTAWLVPEDIRTLRRQLAERAQMEMAK